MKGLTRSSMSWGTIGAMGWPGRGVANRAIRCRSSALKRSGGGVRARRSGVGDRSVLQQHARPSGLTGRPAHVRGMGAEGPTSGGAREERGVALEGHSSTGGWGWAGGKLACAGGGGGFEPLSRTPPPPLLGSRDRNPPQADRGSWVLSTTTYMTQNDPPRCADHFEVCIMGGNLLKKKKSSRRLCGAVDESSSEVLD